MNIFEIIISAAANTGVAEWLAFFTAVMYVILATKENIFCWVFAMISSALYFYVCINSQLYLETILQVFYFAMAIYGWVLWSPKNEKSNKSEGEKIISYSLKRLFPFVLFGAVISPVVGYFFYKYTNASQPFLDAAITTFSFITTWMVAKKILENWLFWIVIDAAAILLFANKELYLTSLLYLIYTVLSFYGYFKWKKTMQPETAS